jgi:hypothetical protein
MCEWLFKRVIGIRVILDILNCFKSRIYIRSQVDMFIGVVELLLKNEDLVTSFFSSSLSWGDTKSNSINDSQSIIISRLIVLHIHSAFKILIYPYITANFLKWCNPCQKCFYYNTHWSVRLCLTCLNTIYQIFQIWTEK